jgi:ABC-type uncharacterized transport system permease subunit
MDRVVPFATSLIFPVLFLVARSDHVFIIFRITTAILVFTSVA